MIPFVLRKVFPQSLLTAFFGDRKKYGFIPPDNDPDWKNWLEYYSEHYDYTQRQLVGKLVSNAGYKILSRISMKNKKVLEIGPGDLLHKEFWKDLPGHFCLADINEEMLAQTQKTLNQSFPNLSKEVVLLSKTTKTLPFPDESFDIFISFFTLEHLYPLDTYLKEISRILKPGGIIIGAVPCEGGLGWGLGRFLTSRRRVKNKTNINPDKVICWEHPNFCDHIINRLDFFFEKRFLSFWPLKLPSIDLNLVSSFIFEKNNP